MITRRSLFWLAASAAFAGAGTGCGGGSASDTRPDTPDPDFVPTYDVTSLRDRFSELTAINNRGQILGRDRNGKIAVTGPDGALNVVELPRTFWDVPDLEGTPIALNDLGAVLGTYRPQYIPNRSFLWQDGVAQDLGSLGGSIVSAAGFNDRNQIVGTSDTIPNALNSRSSFLWQNSQMTPLVPTDGSRFAPKIITNQGAVLGSTENGAALLENGIVRAITDAQTALLGALGINDRSQVFGFTSVRNSRGEYSNIVFLWDNGSLTNITEKGGDPNFTSPRGMNNAGDIVGGASWYGGAPEAPPPVQPKQRAYLYTGGKTYDLQTLLPPDSGWELDYAFDINDQGQIIGLGTNNGGGDYFLLTKK